MRWALFAAVVLTACASAPSPKAPDESHRVAVNRVAPVELAHPDAAEKAPRTVGKDGGVEWR